LYRSEPIGRLRRILNQMEIERLLSDHFHILDYEVATISSSSSPMEHLQLFSDFGLMISSHSSQLVFSAFSPPGSAIIEVLPTFQNKDFAQIATEAGLRYWFALGGKIPSLDPNLSFDECNGAIAVCRGNPDCIEERSPCTKDQRRNFKEQDFEADVTAVELALEQAIQHLNEACNGKWR